jgi:stage V sporulation protein G
MEITDVKITLQDDERLQAFATVTLDACFVVRGLKVIRTSGHLFVAMPARRKPDGSFQDIAHPINAETRRMFEDNVLAEYHRVSGQNPPE